MSIAIAGVDFGSDSLQVNLSGTTGGAFRRYGAGSSLFRVNGTTVTASYLLNEGNFKSWAPATNRQLNATWTPTESGDYTLQFKVALQFAGTSDFSRAPITGDATDQQGASVLTRRVTVQPAVLTNNVARTNLSGYTGNWRDYEFSVPTGTTALEFRLQGSNGDADLYVSRNVKPSGTSADCVRASSGSNETCAFTTNLSGTYYVRVHGFAAYSGATLTAVATLAPNALITNYTTTATNPVAGQPVTLQLNASNNGGGPTNTQGYVSIAIKGAAVRGDSAQTSVVASNSGIPREYSVGDTIRRADGTAVKILAQYLLTEGEWSNWAAAATRTLTTTWTPTRAGPYEVQYRMALQVSGDTYDQEPTTGTVDQQNAFVNTRTVNVTPAPLTAGAPITVAGYQNQWRHYQVSVPTGATRLVIETSGGSGNVGLYTGRQTTYPDSVSTSNTCAQATGASTVRRCVISAPASGLHYILVTGRAPYSNVQLVARVILEPRAEIASTTPSSATTATVGTPIPLSLLARNAGAGAVNTAGYASIAIPSLTARGDSAQLTTTAANGTSYELVVGDTVYTAAIPTQKILASYLLAEGMWTNWPGGNTDRQLNVTWTPRRAGDYRIEYKVGLQVQGDTVSRAPLTGTVTDQQGAVVQTQTISVAARALANATPVTGLAGYQDSWYSFAFAVPTGTTGLTFRLRGTNGNADLLVRRSQAPTLTQADCSQRNAGSIETCSITTNLTGTYYVEVFGSAAYSNASLEVIATVPPNAFIASALPADGTIVQAGDPVILEVLGRNTGAGPTNPYGYLSIGVPILTAPRDSAQLQLSAPLGNAYAKVAGDSIFSFATSARMAAVHLLAEAQWNAWPGANGERTLTTVWTPTRAGAHVVQYKMALQVDSIAFDREPQSGTVIDQQGERVLTRTVNVRPRLITSGIGVTALSGYPGQWRHYRVAVPADAAELVVATSGGSGAVVLATGRQSSYPTPTASDNSCTRSVSGTVQECRLPEPVSGDHFILVYTPSGYTNIQLLATVKLRPRAVIATTVPTTDLTAVVGQALNLELIGRNDGSGAANTAGYVSLAIAGLTVPGDSQQVVVAAAGGTPYTRAATQQIFRVDTTVRQAAYLLTEGEWTNWPGSGATRTLQTTWTPRRAGIYNLEYKVALQEQGNTFSRAPSTGASIDQQGAVVLRRRVIVAPFPIASGVATTLPNGYAGSITHLQIVVQAGVRELRFDTFGGSGDVNLYVGRDTSVSPSSNLWRATGTGSVRNISIPNPAAGTYVVAVHTPTSYTGVALRATAPQPPTAQLVSFGATPTQVRIGEPLTITLTGRNLGPGRTNPAGYLTMAFPSLRSAGDALSISAAAGGGTQVVSPAGANIFRSSGASRVAEYLLADGFWNDWLPNENRTLTVTWTPRTAGTHTIEGKVALQEDAVNFDRAPSSGTPLDQQDASVSRISLEVVAVTSVELGVRVRMPATRVGDDRSQLMVVLRDAAGNWITQQPLSYGLAQGDGVWLVNFNQVALGTSYVVEVTGPQGMKWGRAVTRVLDGSSYREEVEVQRSMPYVSSVTWSGTDFTDMSQRQGNFAGADATIDSWGRRELLLHFRVTNPNAVPQVVRLEGTTDLVAVGTNIRRTPQQGLSLKQMQIGGIGVGSQWPVTLQPGSELLVTMSAGKAYPEWSTQEALGGSDSWPAAGLEGRLSFGFGLRVGSEIVDSSAISSDFRAASIEYRNACNGNYSLRPHSRAWLGSATPPVSRHVVLVHGYQKLSAACGVPKTAEDYWSVDDDSQPIYQIVRELERQGTQVWFWQWPTDLSMFAAGDKLRAAIRSTVPQGAVTIIGHSMGGVVGARALFGGDRLDDRAPRLIALGSPLGNDHLDGFVWREIGLQFSAWEVASDEFYRQLRAPWTRADSARTWVAGGAADRVIDGRDAVGSFAYTQVLKDRDGSNAFRLYNHSAMALQHSRTVWPWEIYESTWCYALQASACTPDEGRALSTAVQEVLQVPTPRAIPTLVQRSPGSTTTIRVGEPITLRISARNSGALVARNAYLSIAFVGLNQAGDRNQVQLASTGQAGGMQMYGVGDGTTITTAAGASVAPRYLLTEFAREFWQPNEQNELRAIWTPTRPGRYTIETRIAMQQPEGGFTYLPALGAPTDEQQGLPVHRVEVEVLAPPQAVLTSFTTFESSSILLGQSVDVQLTGSNNGAGPANWQGYLSVGVRGLNQAGDASQLQLVGGDAAAVTFYDVASEGLTHSDGVKRPATYLLAELARENWAAAASENMAFRFTPTRVGTYTFEYRMALEKDRAGGYARAPLTSSWTDQQGFPAIRRVITVVAPPENCSLQLPLPSGGQSRVVTGALAGVCGRGISVIAEATTGFRFTHWSLDGEVLGTNAALTFDVKRAGNLVATFVALEAQARVSFAASDTALGRVEILAGSAEGSAGREVRLRAVPKARARFLRWMLGSDVLGSNEELAFVAVTDMNVRAEFEALTGIAVSARSATNGSASIVVGDSLGVAGRTVQVIARPTAGSRFVRWIALPSEASVSTDSLLDVMVARDTALAAVFDQQSVLAFTVTPANGGDVNVLGQLTGALGRDVTLTAAARSGFGFLGWYRGAERVDTLPTIVRRMDQSDALSAVFGRLAPVTVQVSPDTAGTYDIVFGSLTGVAGRALQLQARPDSGWRVVAWERNAQLVGTTPDISMTVEDTTRLRLRFARIVDSATVTLSSAATAAGSVTLVDGVLSGQAGRVVQVAAAPVNGWTFRYWSVNGVQASTSRDASFIVLTDLAIVAHFSATAVLSPRSEPARAGSVALLAGTTNGLPGRIVTAQATPNEMWRFTGWRRGTATLGAANPITIAVDSSFDLVALYDSVPTSIITVTPSPADGGTIAVVSGALVGAPERTVVLSARPAARWRFIEWRRADVVVGGDTMLTVLPTSSQQIAAVFERIPTTLTIAVNTDSAGTVAAVEGTLLGAPDRSVRLVARPALRHRFVAWVEADTVIGTDTVVVVSVPQDRRVTARFEVVPTALRVTVQPALSGTVVWVAGDSIGVPGRSVTLRARKADRYRFVQWRTAESVLGTDTTLVINVPNDVDLIAEFQITQTIVSVSVTPDTGGVVVPLVGGLNGDAGRTVRLVARAAPRFAFGGWFVLDSLVSSDSVLAVLADRDRSVSARFSPIPTVLGISASPAEGGQVAVVTGTLTGDPTRSVTVVARTSNGWDYLGWHEGATLLSSDTLLSIPVAVSRNIEARFRRRITLMQADSTYAGGGGPAGEWRYFRVTLPDSISRWRLNLSGGEGELSIYIRRDTIPKLDSALVITAQAGASDSLDSRVLGEPPRSFFVGVYASSAYTGGGIKLRTYGYRDVAIVQTAGGSITMEEGSTRAWYGQPIRLRATPGANSDFAFWRRGSDSVSSANPYSFEATSSATYSAVFTTRQCAVAVSASGAGAASVSLGGITGDCGRTVRLQATSGGLVVFTHWSSNGAMISTAPQFDVAVTVPKTFVGHFISLTPELVDRSRLHLGGNSMLTVNEVLQLDLLGNRDGQFNLGDFLALRDRERAARLGSLMPEPTLEAPRNAQQP